jgi:hypothetical protein
MRKAPGMEKEAHKIPDQISMYRVDVRWLGANPFCEIITGGARPDYENFYNVPEGIEPALFVKSYASVTYKNLYENIDLKFYQTPNGELEYDFIVHPGGDYKKIQLDIQGATLSLNEKQELALTTPLGTITEGALRVHQLGKNIPASWVVQNATTVSYQIESYNPTLDITIDPPVRLWGTYYGGNKNDIGFSVRTDGIGNVYLVGYSSSPNAIATSGGHQNTLAFNYIYDAFLVKFDSSGNRLWGTYYGGENMDWGRACAIDATGNVYLSGQASANFILDPEVISTQGAHQETFGGGAYDAFLVKFNPSGIRIWGTYYGDNGADIPYGTNIDTYGNVYLSGATTSASEIATIGAYQTTYGGNYDAFLVKFDSFGTRLWGTYFGGSGDDYGLSSALDGNGNIYLSGYTNSTIGIASTGAHQTSNGGGIDAFLVKFDASGTRLWGTYYGGNNAELGFSCMSDNSGNIFMTGQTGSAASISTIGSHQTIFGGFYDAFLVKFDSSGTRQWGSYYGGEGYDCGRTCATDINGNIYIAGETDSPSAIATIGAHQVTFADSFDAFLVDFNQSGNCLWGTYYGGNEVDCAYSCISDDRGNVYIAGYTENAIDISTNGSHQSIYGGNCDAFLVKFDSTSAIGINENKLEYNFLILSPNPGQNQLTISGLPEGTIFDLNILNTLGQVVYFSEHLHDSESVKINLPNGLYEVIVETKDARYAQKWVVLN